MSNPTFPVLVGTFGTPDSTKFSFIQEDPTLKTEMEGGYMISRKKHTRTPRLTFSFGYTGLSDTDKETLRVFWNTMSGGSLYFDWTNPQNSTVYTVRFKKAPTFSYTGLRSTPKWDVVFEVEEV